MSSATSARRYRSPPCRCCRLVIDLFLFRAVGFRRAVPAADADLRERFSTPVLLHPVEVARPVSPASYRGCATAPRTPPARISPSASCSRGGVRPPPPRPGSSSPGGRSAEHVPQSMNRSAVFEAVVGVTNDATTRHVVGIMRTCDHGFRRPSCAAGRGRRAKSSRTPRPGPCACGVDGSGC